MHILKLFYSCLEYNKVVPLSWQKHEPQTVVTRNLQLTRFNAFVLIETCQVSNLHKVETWKPTILGIHILRI